MKIFGGKIFNNDILFYMFFKIYLSYTIQIKNVTYTIIR